MTGGPAEPPGLSAGERILEEVEEFIDDTELSECLGVDYPKGGEARAQIARRIDAALAEREAQIAELRQRLEQVIDAAQRVHATDFGMVLGAALHDGNDALTSTADAAACCVERAKAEGAEEMRARCLEIVLAQPYYPDTHTGMRQQWVKGQIAAAIRALK